MNVVVAPDKFAGTLTAAEAAVAIDHGWRQQRPADHLVLVPMSDGGPGFVAVLHAGLGGDVSVVQTTGPHGDPVAARVLYVGGEIPTAYVEAADCCGLHLAPEPRRPLEATADGLAVMLRAALALPVARIVVGVGGTASTDGGRGVAAAVGEWPPDVELIVATDVEHPLLGAAGAAQSFAPQKGASASEVAELDRRLTEWARTAGIDPEQPGGGAGGGLAYGLIALGGRRISGAMFVAECRGLAREIGGADLVVTGEGAIDFSSLHGKVVGVVGALALQSARPCVAVAGRVDVGRREAAVNGLDETYALIDRVGEAAAMTHAADQLAALAAVVAAHWS